MPSRRPQSAARWTAHPARSKGGPITATCRAMACGVSGQCGGGLTGGLGTAVHYDGYPSSCAAEEPPSPRAARLLREDAFTGGAQDEQAVETRCGVERDEAGDDRLIDVSPGARQRSAPLRQGLELGLAAPARSLPDSRRDHTAADTRDRHGRRGPRARSARAALSRRGHQAARRRGRRARLPRLPG